MPVMGIGCEALYLQSVIILYRRQCFDVYFNLSELIWYNVTWVTSYFHSKYIERF